MIAYPGKANKRPDIGTILELAGQVEDWHKAPQREENPIPLEEDRNIQWKKNNTSYTGEYKNRQGGRYMFTVTRTRSEDHVGRTVMIEESYSLVMVKDGREETISFPKDKVQKLYQHATRVGSKTQSFAEEVA